MSSNEASRGAASSRKRAVRPTTSPASVSSSRISGVDVARALAVLGMFAVHVGPDSADSLARGRDTALFAGLAGVSIALLSGGHTPPSGQAATRAAVRIVVRAALLIPLGLLLTALGTDIEVILVFYGAFFLLALPVLRLRPRTLAGLAVVFAVLGPLASYALRSRFWSDYTSPDEMDFSAITSPHGLAVLFLLGPYPVFSYMSFIFGGMAVGRLDLRRPDVAVRLIAVGAVLALLGYGGSWLALHPLGGYDHIVASASSRGLSTTELFDNLDGFVPTTSLTWLLTSDAHSGTPFWIAGVGGLALIVLGGCLLLTGGGIRGRVRSVTLAPLANLGAMVLTAYSLHIVAIAIFGAHYDWLELVTLSSVMLLFAMLWRRRWRRAALEGLLHVCSTKVAQALVPEDAAPRPLARHLTYVKVTATLALFVALTGSFAAVTLAREEAAEPATGSGASSEIADRSEHLGEVRLRARKLTEPAAPGHHRHGVTTALPVSVKEVTTKLAHAPANDDTIAGATASCAPGQKAIAGGVQVDDADQAYVIDDYPDDNGTAWSGHAGNDDDAAPHNFTVYAICAG